MKMRKLFLSLSPEDKDKVCSIVNEVGIGIQLGTLDYRKFLKERMFTVTGNARVFIKLFRRMDEAEQERFYRAMVNYD